MAVETLHIEFVVRTIFSISCDLAASFHFTYLFVWTRAGNQSQSTVLLERGTMKLTASFFGLTVTPSDALKARDLNRTGEKEISGKIRREASKRGG